MKTGKKANEHYFSRNPKSEHRRTVISCTMRGKNCKFITDASTFSKAKVDKGTRLLVDSMKIQKSDVVLDLGCGYGPIGIIAASLATDGKCYMTDINRRSVELAKKNIELNGITNAEVRLGSAFEPFDRTRFDVILTNPPISAGRKTVMAFIDGAYKHLKQDGSFYLVARTRQGAKTLKELMKDVFGNSEYASMGGGYRVIVSRKYS